MFSLMSHCCCCCSCYYSSTYIHVCVFVCKLSNSELVSVICCVGFESSCGGISRRLNEELLFFVLLTFFLFFTALPLSNTHAYIDMHAFIHTSTQACTNTLTYTVLHINRYAHINAFTFSHTHI